MARMVLTLALLQKAKRPKAGPGQLGLFNAPRKVNVRPHIRHTKTGAVPVAPHTREVRPGEQVPLLGKLNPRAFFPRGAPEPEPTPEPEPKDATPAALPAEPVRAIVESAETSAEMLRNHAAHAADLLRNAADQVREEAADPGPEPAKREEADPPTHESSAHPDQPTKLESYAYARKDPDEEPPWTPEGMSVRDGVYISAEPLHHSDARLLGLVPHDRPWDPYETGHFTVDDDGENPHEHITSGAAPRELFAPLESRWSEFQSKIGALAKRAKRLNLDAPDVAELARIERKVGIEVRGWDGQPTMKYERRPARLVRVRNPDVKVKGWTLEAVIRNVPGTDRTIIARIGKADDLPDRLRHTGMHCDQCGTNRQRGFVVAMRNDTSGAWQQVGGSCLRDFTGRSAANLASSTEYLQGLSADLDDYDHDPLSVGGKPRAFRFSVDDVLLAAVAMADEQGGFVSKRAAEDAGVKSTAHIAGELLEKPHMAAAIRANDGYVARAKAIRDWMGTIEADGSDYMENLRTYGEAEAVLPRHFGLVVSAVGAYDRAMAEQAAARSRGTPKHFGAKGDKIGRKLSKKDRDAGATAHPRHRVKVISRYSFDTQYGTSTYIVARDNDGHTFKWKASGVPSRANPDPDMLGHQDILPGETFDLVATIKGHSDYKGTPQTDVTRAEFHRVHTAQEQAQYDQQLADYKARTTQRPALLEKIRTEFEAARPEFASEVVKHARYAHMADERATFARWREAKLQSDPTLFRRADWEHDNPPNDHDIRRARDATEPARLEADAKDHAAEYIRHRAALTVSQPMEEDMAKATPGRMDQPRPGDQPQGEIPPTPGQRVKFKHPHSGEMEDGHIHAKGGMGATVVDGHGQTHKVPHGHYVHHDGDEGEAEDAKPDGELVKQAARKHLEHGADKPLAVHGAAAMLVAGGVKTAHALRSQDVRINGGKVQIVPDKLQTDEPGLVKILGELKRRNATGPIFQVGGKPITEQSLTLYVRRFGRSAGSTAPEPMAKATASALDLPAGVDGAAAEWSLFGYLVKFAKAAGGLGVCTIEHESMPLPLIEVCSTRMAATKFAQEAVSALRSGVAPKRGIYQATR